MSFLLPVCVESPGVCALRMKHPHDTMKVPVVTPKPPAVTTKRWEVRLKDPVSTFKAGAVRPKPPAFSHNAPVSRGNPARRRDRVACPQPAGFPENTAPKPIADEATPSSRPCIPSEGAGRLSLSLERMEVSPVQTNLSLERMEVPDIPTTARTWGMLWKAGGTLWCRAGCPGQSGAGILPAAFLHHQSIPCHPASRCLVPALSSQLTARPCPPRWNADFAI